MQQSSQRQRQRARIGHFLPHALIVLAPLIIAFYAVALTRDDLPAHLTDYDLSFIQGIITLAIVTAITVPALILSRYHRHCPICEHDRHRPRPTRWTFGLDRLWHTPAAWAWCALLTAAVVAAIIVHIAFAAVFWLLMIGHMTGLIAYRRSGGAAPAPHSAEADTQAPA